MSDRLGQVQILDAALGDFRPLRKRWHFDYEFGEYHGV